jgi:hypothetical protein
MRSSRTITLFSERPDLAQRSSSFVISVVFHAAAGMVLSYGIIHTPVTTDAAHTPHYTVRHLDLHTSEPKQQASSKGGKAIRYPGPSVARQAAAAGDGNPVPQEAALRQTAEAEPGPQTLVQPDISHPAHLKEAVLVPTVVIWAPKKQVVKDVVAPLPEPATASDVKPSLQAPNAEVNLTDLSMAASDTPSQLQFLPPSTTSPLVVHGPEKAQLPPVTASQNQAAPTPTAVESLSDLKMKDGAVMLPPVNETDSKKQDGPLREGEAGQSSAPGQGNLNSTAGGSGSGTGAGGGAASADGATTDAAADAAEAKTYPAPGRPATAGGSGAATSHFTLPKEGQFGAVVVGATMQEEYPEIAGMWGGRMAYTVYLHVGLEKTWILQYSIPRAADAASGGSTPRLEAPWPYNIVRPNLTAGAINADALMVHGFVDEAGRFESLAVAFPPEFPQAEYVLNALTQWQFRPAEENGRPAKVEVVLIIPEVGN